MADYIMKKCEQNKIYIPEMGGIDIKGLISKSLGKLEEQMGFSKNRIDYYIKNEIEDWNSLLNNYLNDIK